MGVGNRLLHFAVDLAKLAQHSRRQESFPLAWHPETRGEGPAM